MFNILVHILQSLTLYISTHLKLCLAAATHNSKWVKIAPIYLISDQTFENYLNVQTQISFSKNRELIA